MDSNIRRDTPSETSADTSGEASRQTEIPMLTVAVMQANRLSASSASSAAVQAVTTNRMADGEEIPPPKPDFSAPPPYEMGTKLPSYEEVQREKSLEGETLHIRVACI